MEYVSVGMPGDPAIAAALEKEHRALHEMIRELRKSSETGNPAATLATLDKLIAFCIGHFEHEERSIAKHWTGGLEKHNAAHRSLMDSLHTLRSMVPVEDGLNIREAVGDLIVKVNDHLDRYDQRALERIALGGPEQGAAERFWPV